MRHAREISAHVCYQISLNCPGQSAVERESKLTLRVRIKPGIAMVRIADPVGQLHDCFGEGTVLPEWASHDSKQIVHFMDLNLIEPCDESGRPLDPGRVWECVSALGHSWLARGCRRSARAGDAAYERVSVLE